MRMPRCTARRSDRCSPGSRLANLESERDAGKMGICFGSRKLFREQFALEKNDFASHEEWLAAWRQARSSQFFAIGSRDETAGCQSCVAAVQDDGSVTLRIRLPDALGAGKHLAIARVRFAYGHDAIVAAIGRNRSEDQAEWQAISYRSFMMPGAGECSCRSRSRKLP